MAALNFRPVEVLVVTANHRLFHVKGGSFRSRWHTFVKE
jgi:hypothetical protein